MTVYIEYVIIDNFVIDYLLLKAAFTLTNTPVRKGRLFFCAFFGAVAALVYPLLQLHALLLAAIKIVTGLLIALLAADYKNVKHYYINAILFITLTFATGGAIMGIFNLVGLSYSTEFSVAFMILPAYAVIKAITAVIKYIYRRKDVAARTYPCELVLNGKTIKTDGLLDTGNMLYDGDSPVIVCNKEIAIKLIDKTLPEIKRIECNTVNGKSFMPALKLTAVKIYSEENRNIIYNVTLAVTRSPIGTGYGVILHPALMEKNYVEYVDKTQGIS